jgi:hypothetical protein
MCPIEHLDNNRSGQNTTNLSKTQRNNSPTQITSEDHDRSETEDERCDIETIRKTNEDAIKIPYYDENIDEYENDEEMGSSTYTSIVQFDEQQSYQDIRDNTIYTPMVQDAIQSDR